MVAKLIILLTALSWCAFSSALSGDKEAPIKIVSDRAEQNEQEGTATYEGSVIVQQGSIKINADKVIVTTDAKRGDKIVATGNPAHYQQIQNTQEGLVLASANIINYSIKNEKIGLIKDASLEQNGITITGNQIDYDVQAATATASSEQNKKNRIEMIIPPTK